MHRNKDRVEMARNPDQMLKVLKVLKKNKKKWIMILSLANQMRKSMTKMTQRSSLKKLKNSCQRKNPSLNRSTQRTIFGRQSCILK